jgi:drug/metabolite transporter (DMT)-like permease
VAFATSLAAVTVTGRLRFHSLEQTGIAAFFGAVSIGVPALMYNVAMSRVGSADAAAFKLLIPVFAFIYGVALLGETPNASSLAGGLMVIASVAIYQTSGSDREKS